MKKFRFYFLLMIFLNSFAQIGWTGDCERPKGLTSEVISESTVNLAWPAINGATGYLLRVKEADDNPVDFDLEITVATNNYTVNNLKAGESYEFRVRTLCGDDHSNWADDFVFKAGNATTNPPASTCDIPSGLMVTETTATTATLSWNAVPGASQYELEVEDGNNTLPFAINVIVSATTHTVSGLTPNGQYKFKVKAKCDNGQNSEYSNIVFFNASSGNTPGGSCDIPSGLMVTETTGTTATLSWNAVPGASQFELEVEDGDNTLPFVLNALVSTTSYTITGLAPNGQYKFKVKAKCDNGQNSEYSNIVFFNASSGNTPGGSCDIPSGLMVTETTGTTATLSWNAVPSASQFELQVEDGDNTLPFVLNALVSTTSYTITGLEPNGQYKFKVKAKCDNGQNSEYSNIVFFNASSGNTPGGSCDIPSGLMVTETTGTTATLSWNAVPSASQYELEVEDGDNTPAFVLNVIVSATSHIVTGLVPNGQYKFKVKALCLNGLDSEYSVEIVFTASSPTPLTNISGSRFFTIFPNPADQYVNLTLEANLNEGNIEVKVFNIHGVMVRESYLGEYEGQRLAIDLADLPNGMYVLRTESKGLFQFQQKFMILHK